MELNYIIHAHKNPQQLKRLVERLSTPNTNFYIHIDRSIDLKPFRDELTSFNNLFLFDDNQRIRVTWANISQVEATLIAIKKVISDNRKGYCILMSGQDYPIKTNQYINSFFESNKGKNFISGAPMLSEKIWRDGLHRIEKYNFHPYENERVVLAIPSIYDLSFYTKQTLRNIRSLLKTGERKHIFKIFVNRNLPDNVSLYNGSNWWAFPIETLLTIDEFVENNPKYINYHKWTHCTDEIFFHSIVFSKLNNQLISDSVTYVNWTRKGCQLPVTFTEDDFDELTVNNDKLFARKFDVPLSSAIFDKIDREILLAK